MKNIFFLIIYLSFSISWSQDKATSTDIATQDALKQELKNLSKQARQVSLLKTKEEFHKLQTKLKEIKKNIKYKDTDHFKAIDSIHAKAITFFMGSVLYPLNELDSMIYYNEYLKENIPIDVYLTKSSGMAAFAKFATLDFVGAIKSYDETYAILKKSNSMYSQHEKVSLLLDLTGLYLYFRSFSNAQETLNLAELEMNKYEKFKKKNNKFRLKHKYIVAKLGLLSAQERNKEFLALSETLNVNEVKDNGTKLAYLYVLMKFNINNNNLDLGQQYYQQIFKGKEFEIIRKPKEEIDTVLIPAKIAIKEGDFQKAKDYIFSEVTKNKNIQLPIEYLLLVSEYYELAGDYKKAYKTVKSYHHKLDSIVKINKMFIVDIANYKISIEASTIGLNKVNTEKSTIINNFIILTVSISIVLMLFIILYFLKKQKNFKDKLEVLKQKELTALKSTFLENMSHEIRTPITSIIGYLVLLKQHTLDTKKTKHYLDLTLKNSEKMMSSLNSFLMLLKAEGGTIRANKKTSYSVNLFLKEIFSSFAADLKIKKINFYYKTNVSDSLIVPYDFKSFKTITENLISNAIAYSNTNASIYFTINLTVSDLHITVRDTGFGIPKEDKEKIFVRFYQSKRNTNTSGFGIGLSLVADLIQNLQGSITLESKLNVGSIFHVTLPLQIENHALHVLDENLNFELLSIDNKETRDPIKEPNKQPKVLVVDDSIEMITYLKEILSDKLDCSYAFNGQEALSMLKERSFDLIISDLRMPLIDGLQLKEMLNKLDTYKDTPFIMITATYQDKLEELKAQLGIIEYIEKPFTRNEILSRIQLSLERSMYKKEIFSLENNVTDFKGSETLIIHKIKENILANLTNKNFNSKMLAQLCGYQQKQLNTILKAKVGLSIVQIILEVRLLHASDALVKNLYATLNEVMFASGISSRSYFNKAFEERFGITPNKFKKKYNS